MANTDFGKKPVSEITSPMVLRCLRKVEAKGNYETAHRLRARIGSIFRYAVASGIAESDPNRRPDVVVFVNGLPLAVLELKSAASATATIEDAYAQLRTYKEQIPSLFRTNAVWSRLTGYMAALAR